MTTSQAEQVEYYKQRQKFLTFSNRKFILIEKIRKFVRPGDIVFDFGCGDGLISAAIANFGALVTGFDRDTRAVSQKMPFCAFKDLNLYELKNISPLACDVSLILDVLEHVEDEFEKLIIQHIWEGTNKFLIINTPIGQMEEQPIDRPVDWVSILQFLEHIGAKTLLCERFLNQYMFMVFKK